MSRIHLETVPATANETSCPGYIFPIDEIFRCSFHPRNVPWAGDFSSFTEFPPEQTIFSSESQITLLILRLLSFSKFRPFSPVSCFFALSTCLQFGFCAQIYISKVRSFKPVSLKPKSPCRERKFRGDRGHCQRFWYMGPALIRRLPD